MFIYLRSSYLTTEKLKTDKRENNLLWKNVLSCNSEKTSKLVVCNMMRKKGNQTYAMNTGIHHI